MDIFTCGVCKLETNKIEDYWEHKQKNNEVHECKLCDAKFHHKDELLSHQMDSHQDVKVEHDESTVESDQTQVKLLVAHDNTGNIVLDGGLLQQIIDATGDGSGSGNNVHIIVNEDDSETKISDEDAVQVLYMPSSSVDIDGTDADIEKDGESSKDKSGREAFFSRIYVCKLCNHFSYQKRGVLSHLVQAHQKNVEFGSPELDDYVQELEILPCSEEQDDSINELIESVGDTDVRNRSSKSKKRQHYCTDCKTNFPHYRALKNHVCDSSAGDTDSNASVDDSNMEGDDSDSDSGKRSGKRGDSSKSKRHMSLKKSKKMKREQMSLDDPSAWDEPLKSEWERIELEKEIVFACVDHLYSNLENDEETDDADKSSENDTYKCNVCQKVMSTLTDIRTHCLTHTVLKPYRCSTCKYSTKVKSLMLKHLTKHTAKNEEIDQKDKLELGIYNCELCIEDFENLLSLAVHFQRHHRTNENCPNLLQMLACEKLKLGETEQFRCFFCFDNFEKEEECLEHVKSLHFSNQAVINGSQNDAAIKTWKCPMCHHTTSYAKPFLKHVTKHKLIFSCRDCPENFLSSMKLTQHIEDNHLDCDAELPMTKLDEMVQLSVSESWYLPEDISKRLNAVIMKACQKLRESDDANLMRIIGILKYKRLTPQIYQHIKQTLGSVECFECGRLFFSQAELKRHDGIHAVDKQFKCNRCEYSAATKDNLSRHIAKIHEKTILKCPSCEYTTLCQTTLWKHKKTHQSKLECTECQKKFEKLKQLRQHMIECHLDNNIKLVDETGNVIKKSVANSSFKCPHCPRVFHRSIQEFKRHMWIHEGIKPIKCTKCSYKCRTANHLQVHMRKHSNVKEYQCPHCYKDFKSKGSLQYHMQRFHSDGQKTMYSCDRCNYTTAQKGHLKLHLRNHLVVRKYRCPMCDYSSNTQSSLKGHHKKKHKGVEFSAISNEEPIHDDSRDGEIPVYKCNTCDYRFTNVTDFRRHFKIKHGLLNFNWSDVVIKVKV
ncbi:hypothetical protein CHUAL_003410 [Chamberlinius hualienensis]